MHYTYLIVSNSEAVLVKITSEHDNIWRYLFGLSQFWSSTDYLVGHIFVF